MILTRDEEPIVALCTPTGSGAIGVLRISGSGAINVAHKCAQLASKKSLDACASHTVHFGWVVEQDGTQIDQVLFTIMRAPKSYTGQDTVEISCHNNPFIIEKIIQKTIACGARPAQHGEFTKRAYLNKKIDLIQAEAVNELIHAHTHQAIKHALAQLQGSLSHWVIDLEQQLLKAHSLCEASFEFIEDENINFDSVIKEHVDTCLKKIYELQKQYSQQAHIKEGVRVVIIGAVNAGKSSLFNALIQKERAIVTPIAGTTHDTIEAGIYRDNIYLTLVDTAGFRSTKNKIEQEGIKRAAQEAKLADVVVLVGDSSKPSTPAEQKWFARIQKQYGHKVIAVGTKSDVRSSPLDTIRLRPTGSVGSLGASGEKFLPVSASTGENIALLEQEILKRAKSLINSSSCSFLINKRQAQLLDQLAHELEALAPKLVPPLEHELVSVHLRDALEKITELTGKSISELSLDKIFQDFCVGK